MPLGYVLVEVEKRGTKIKKTLAIDPVDAETVHLIYKLYISMATARPAPLASARVTTGPILLSGLAVCATCNGGMTLRTGTSKTGAVHRYYARSTCARKGKTVCKGRSIPMAKLDNLVTIHMNERLAIILSSLSSRRSEKADSVNARVTALQREATDADEKAQAAISAD